MSSLEGAAQQALVFPVETSLATVTGTVNRSEAAPCAACQKQYRASAGHVLAGTARFLARSPGPVAGRHAPTRSREPGLPVAHARGSPRHRALRPRPGRGARPLSATPAMAAAAASPPGPAFPGRRAGHPTRLRVKETQEKSLSPPSELSPPPPPPPGPSNSPPPPSLQRHAVRRKPSNSAEPSAGAAGRTLSGGPAGASGPRQRGPAELRGPGEGGRAEATGLRGRGELRRGCGKAGLRARGSRGREPDGPGPPGLGV